MNALGPLVVAIAILFAMLAIANVSFGRWFRFMLPAFAGLLLIGAVAIAIGVRTGF